MPELLNLGDARGDPELRLALAEFLRQYRGVRCEPGQLVLGAGVEYLLDLLIRIMDPGASFALEDPGYGGIYRAVRAAGRAFHAIPLDSEGLDAAALADSGARYAFVTPRTIPTASQARRAARAADRGRRPPGRYVIEDDTTAEFRTPPGPSPPCRAWTGSAWCNLGTFSRTIPPSIRAPTVLPGRVKAYRERLGARPQPIPFEQQTLPALHQRCCTPACAGWRLYRRRRNLLAELFSLTRRSPLRATTGAALSDGGGRPPRESAGRRAAAAGVRVRGAERVRCKAQAPPSTLVIGYAGLSEEDIGGLGAARPKLELASLTRSGISVMILDHAPRLSADSGGVSCATPSCPLPVLSGRSTTSRAQPAHRGHYLAPAGLHDTPDTLRASGGRIDSYTTRWRRILKTSRTTSRWATALLQRGWAWPRGNPWSSPHRRCIALFLGSQKRYLAAFERYNGTTAHNAGSSQRQHRAAARDPAAALQKYSEKFARTTRLPDRAGGHLERHYNTSRSSTPTCTSPMNTSRPRCASPGKTTGASKRSGHMRMLKRRLRRMERAGN